MLRRLKYSSNTFRASSSVILPSLLMSKREKAIFAIITSFSVNKWTNSAWCIRKSVNYSIICISIKNYEFAIYIRQSCIIIKIYFKANLVSWGNFRFCLEIEKFPPINCPAAVCINQSKFEIKQFVFILCHLTSILFFLVLNEFFKCDLSSCKTFINCDNLLQM